MEFRDLKKQYQRYKIELDKAIHDVLEQTDFINGPSVKRLEERLASYAGVKHCITCANGTDALYLVLKAWNIGPHDAVFVPNFTFFATAEAVSQVGATPIFVDVDPYTYNISPDHLEKMIKDTIKEGKYHPKAIIPVDLFGLLADYSKIQPLAKKYKLLVLEDAAQGFGASYHGQRACSFGDAAITSFFPAKPLGCYGDGGAIFTNDDTLASLLRSLAVHGKGSDKYDNVRIGQNSRIDTLQAAILHVKLDAFINHELSDVNQVYQWYQEYLGDIVVTPTIPKHYISCFAQYSIQLNSYEERHMLKEFLELKNIPTMIYYRKTMHQQTAYAHLNISDHEYPVSIALTSKVLQLPIHPYLSQEDVLEITSHVKLFIQSYRGEHS